MAPSEESILINFLVSPSSFPTIISLEKFTELFPRRLQSHPQIRVLYRELQHQRSQDIDFVRENIEKETKRGEKQKEELRKAKNATGVSQMEQHDAVEADMDIHLFGQPPNLAAENSHTLKSLLPELQQACASIEKEIETTEADAARVLADITSVVGELSDLRYGKLNKPAGAANDPVDDTIRGLKQLQETSDRIACHWAMNMEDS